MARRTHAAARAMQLGKFGFLFADLFAVLAVLFLVANTGEPAAPVIAAPQPTASTPVLCGLDPNPKDDYDFKTASVPDNDVLGLQDGADTPDGMQARQDYKSYALTYLFGPGNLYQPGVDFTKKDAGFVEVLGGAGFNSDAAHGEALSQGIMDAFQLIGGTFFSPQRVRFFPKVHDSSIPFDQAHIYIIFYQINSNGQACSL